jgi:hypothetical protein
VERILATIGLGAALLWYNPDSHLGKRPNIILPSAGEKVMAKTTERALGLAVMRVLAQQPNGEATVRTLIRRVPAFVRLTAQDREQSDTRPLEEMWEQRVRNLKSHDKTGGNVIGEGFVGHVGRGRYRLTAAGRLHLEHHGLI